MIVSSSEGVTAEARMPAGNKPASIKMHKSMETNLLDSFFIVFLLFEQGVICFYAGCECLSYFEYVATSSPFGATYTTYPRASVSFDAGVAVN